MLNLSRGLASKDIIYNTDMENIFNAFAGIESQRLSLGGLTITPATDGARFLVEKADGTDVFSVNTSTGVITGAGVSPAGSMIMYGGATAPTGWLLCDGSAISRTTYASLFAVLSTTYGAGDTTTTFNVPDMRGVFPKGAGTTARAAGKDANGNYYAGTLGTYLTDKMQGHYHTVTSYTPWADSIGGKYNLMLGTQAVGGGWGDITSAVSVVAPKTDGTNGTPRAGLTTEPQSLGVTYIIKT
jgi:microcystin-dependent protein